MNNLKICPICLNKFVSAKGMLLEICQSCCLKYESLNKLNELKVSFRRQQTYHINKMLECSNEIEKIERIIKIFTEIL